MADVQVAQNAMNEFIQQHDMEENEHLEIETSSDLPDDHFPTTIDPPANQSSMQWIHSVFEPNDEGLLLGDLDDLDIGSADEDYELHSLSSSSSDEELPDHPSHETSDQSARAKEFKDQTSNIIAEPPRKAASSYQDILNEIFEEEIEIPERSNLGPKPWLMKPRNPRNTYDIITPLSRKPRNSPSKAVEPQEIEVEEIKSQIDPAMMNFQQDTKRNEEVKRVLDPETKIDLVPKQDDDENPAFHSESSKGRASSASSGNAISDNERPDSAKYPSEADTGFGSNTSSNPSPNNSSSNISRLPSRERRSSSDIKKEEDVANDKKKAQELAQAALQALSLSKNLLKDMEKNGGPVTASDPECIYDEVPVSPLKKPTHIHEDIFTQQNVYDDVAMLDHIALEKTEPKRTVISVPKYVPPQNPVRKNPNPVMSSQPIYDITRSNNPQNLSGDAMALMYKLFGREQQPSEPIDNRLYSRPYSRPSSVKSVTFEDEVRSQYTDDGSRPPSRNGSIYSEWSDCTINLPDYPEPESTRQVEFPSFPQVGYPSNPPQHTQAPNSNMQNIYNPNFTLPNSTNFAPSFPPPHPNPNFHSPNEPWRNQSPYARFPGQIQQPPNPYDVRNPSPMYPPNYNLRPGPNMLNFPSNAPYPRQPMGSHMEFQNRPLSHAPPTNQWGGFSPSQHYGAFSPPRNFHGRPKHHQARVNRGRSRGRNDHRGSRSQSRSKSRTRRFSYESDEGSRSPSPSPVRRRDVIDTDVIAGRSFIDGYKAALKDAVLTFAEQQKKKKKTPQFHDQERDVYQKLRRTLSAGRIRELPDNIELGDLRKALAIPNKSYSDDEYELFDRDDDDFVIPSTGRPSSRRGSFRKQQRGWRPSRNDDVAVRRPQERMGIPSDSEEDSCGDYSDYDDDVMQQQQKRCYDDYRDDDRNMSSKNRVLKQRYIDSFQKSSSNIRAPVRPNNEFDDRDFVDVRNQRSEARRRFNYEDVTFPDQNDGWNQRNDGNSQQHRGRMMDDFRGQPPQQRGSNRNYQHHDGREKRRGARFGYDY